MVNCIFVVVFLRARSDDRYRSQQSVAETRTGSKDDRDFGDSVAVRPVSYRDRFPVARTGRMQFLTCSLLSAIFLLHLQEERAETVEGRSPGIPLDPSRRKHSLNMH